MSHDVTLRQCKCIPDSYVLRLGVSSLSGCVLSLLFYQAVLLWVVTTVPRAAAAGALESTLSAPVVGSLPPPIYYAALDYSGANEYVAAHYGTSSFPQTPFYFGSTRSHIHRREPVWNGRQGILVDPPSVEDGSTTLRPASLQQCGFTLLKEKTTPLVVQDWTSLDEIRRIYLPALRERLAFAYAPRKIVHVIFWNGVVRSDLFSQTRESGQTPTASYAAAPHIDIDINAYLQPDTVDDMISLFEKNDISGSSSTLFPREEIKKAIRSGHRFAIVNAWRNIDTTHVVSRAPLALLATRYPRNSPFPAFPHSAPDMTASRWYTFPNMTCDELLLFCQYDRDVRQPSDVWHCALTSVDGQGEGSPPRKSFDVRCLIILDETVPIEWDRFPTRNENAQKKIIPSILTKEQSEAFCSQQALQRYHDEPK